MSKTVRMTDIASKIGVSTVTVSKALSDKDGVSDEMRAKIKELAIEMGYQFSSSHKKTLNNFTGNIGILILEHFVQRSNAYYWDLYERVINRLSANGYYGILEVVKDEDEKDNSLPRLLHDNKVDGIIMIGQFDLHYRKMLRSRCNLAMMCLDFYDGDSESDCIISNGYHGMYQMTNYLLSMGHKDIWFVGIVNVTSSVSDRYFGYCRAMLEAGINVTPDMILRDHDESGTLRVELPEKLPTAMACNNDIVAYEVINELKQKGYHVPDDISVVGYDNYIYSDLSIPTITTYEVDRDTMARSCVDRLLRKISNKCSFSKIKVIDGKLVIKDSVKQLI